MIKKLDDGVIIVGWSQAPTMLGSSSADCWALGILTSWGNASSEDYIKHGCELCTEDELCELHAYRASLACEGFYEQDEKGNETCRSVALFAIEFDEYSKLVDIFVDNVKQANKLIAKYKHKERLKYLPVHNAIEIEDEYGGQHLTYAPGTIAKKAFKNEEER